MIDRTHLPTWLPCPPDAAARAVMRTCGLVLLLAFSCVSGTVPAAAGAPSGGGREQPQHLQVGCAREAFDAAACRDARAAVERELTDGLRTTRAYVLLAQAYWNASWLDGTVEERQAWRARAKALGRQAIARDPDNAATYFALSAYTDDHQEQVDLLQLTVDRDPRHPEAHALLARLLLLQDRVDDALAAYRTHLEVSPYRGRADGFKHVAFAQDLAAAGRTHEAAGIFERVLALSRADSRFERCIVFRNVDLSLFGGFDSLVRAVEALRLCCTKTAQRDRAVRLERAGRTDAAIDALQQQVRENPYFEETYALLARLYRERGETAAAWRVVKQSLDMETESHERCRKYRELAAGAYAALEPAYVARLRLECEE